MTASSFIFKPFNPVSKCLFVHLWAFVVPCWFSCPLPHLSVLTPAHSLAYLRSLPSLSAPIRVHSHSLPHVLMHEYLRENDKSPFMCKDMPKLTIKYTMRSSLMFVPLWVAVFVSKRWSSAAGVSVYVIYSLHVLSRAGGVGENVDGVTSKRVEVVEDWAGFLADNVTCKTAAAHAI